MELNTLQLEQSGWWVLLLIVLSIGGGFLLYSKKNTPWGRIQNNLLLAIRSLVIFLILFILLDPKIKSSINTTNAPVVSLLIDNSESMVTRNVNEDSLKTTIEELIKKLKTHELGVEITTLNQSDSIKFSTKETDLGLLFRKEKESMRMKNHVASILITDGIFNKGSSPEYLQQVKPIYTIGIGDTISPKDIRINNLEYNKVAYLGNRTPINVEILQQGYSGKNITITLKQGKEQVVNKTEVLASRINQFNYLIDVKKEGLLRVDVMVENMPGEFSEDNNLSTAYINVIDAKKKVLILASAPHPDIKAIRNTLNSSGNYETQLYLSKVTKSPPKGPFDLVIYHDLLKSPFTILGSPGEWFILGKRSTINQLNTSIPFLNIASKRGKPDKVVGGYNPNFSKYKIINDSNLEGYPPLEVPFADYSILGPAEVLLYQKLGSVTTNKPLMLAYDNGQEKKILNIGTGLWKWKLQEYAVKENSGFFNELIAKSAQYLVIKNDKKQFKFKPATSSFTSKEPINFYTETYNDIYEKVYGNEISLTVTHENGNSKSFNFQNAEFKNYLTIPSLETGVYSYEAKTSQGSQVLKENGQFIVTNLNPEIKDLTANHLLLKRIAKNSGAIFSKQNKIDQTMDHIADKEFKSIIRSEESVTKLATQRWYFLIILLLLSTEWLLRKYWGAY